MGEKWLFIFINTIGRIFNVFTRRIFNGACSIYMAIIKKGENCEELVEVFHVRNVNIRVSSLWQWVK